MAVDETAIVTWANMVTVTRVLASPFLFLMIPDDGGSWAALAVWIILCASDGFDGYLARRHGITRSGTRFPPRVITSSNSRPGLCVAIAAM